jgi:hypothetical protein
MLEGQKQKVHSLVDKVHSPKNLRLAWERVRANRGACGTDGITIEEFEANLDANLERLGDQRRLNRWRLPRRNLGTGERLLTPSTPSQSNNPRPLLMRFRPVAFASSNGARRAGFPAFPSTQPQKIGVSYPDASNLAPPSSRGEVFYAPNTRETRGSGQSTPARYRSSQRDLDHCGD